MLQVNSLKVSIENKQIIKGIDLSVNPGELHVIMGPNGSGKSTFANVLAGKENYTIESGSVEYNGKKLIEMNIEERACEGIFLSFQYPISIPGVNNMYFLKEALNSQRKYNGLEEIDSVDFLEMIKENLKLVELDESFIHRSVNEGFSGGEKKRNEILQMVTLNPKLSILDETDSGLDIDALKIVAEGVNKFRNKDKSFILITHYHRILNYLEPDMIHVLMDGKIVKSGDKSLAMKLEDKGYGWIRAELDARS